MSHSKLLDTPKSLKKRMPDNIKNEIIFYSNKTVNRIVEYFPFIKLLIFHYLCIEIKNKKTLPLSDALSLSKWLEDAKESNINEFYKFNTNFGSILHIFYNIKATIEFRAMKYSAVFSSQSEVCALIEF